MSTAIVILEAIGVAIMRSGKRAENGAARVNVCGMNEGPPREHM